MQRPASHGRRPFPFCSPEAPAAVGTALIVGSAIAFALDGPVARAAYQQGLDPATFGFWRASAGVMVLGGWLATGLRPGALAAIRQMRGAAAIRLALAAVLHAAYILLGRGGWGGVGDSAAAFLIVATGAAGLGAVTAATRPSSMLTPVTDFRLTGLLVFEGVLAGAAAPLLFLAGLRRIGATQTAVLSLCEPLTATLLAAVMLRQLPAPTQLLGAGLLVGAGIAIQIVPARPGRAGVGKPGALELSERSAGDVGEHRGYRAGAV